VARGRAKSTHLREPAIEELEWLRLTLTSIGGQWGEAIETLSWNAFVLVDDLLSPQSSPRDWLRNGGATWIEGLRAGADLVRGVCSNLSRSLGPSEPQYEVEPGKITFFVDQFTEATDPVETEIPVELITKVKVGPGDIQENWINLTVSSDGKTVLVALYNLTIPLGKPPSKREPRAPVPSQRSTTLSWGRGAPLTIVLQVAKTTAP
jgi:hypothetical protein